jgi:DNA-binding MarR family transcriptional regulator
MGVDKEVQSMIDDWRRERPDVDMASLHVFLPLRRALQEAEARRERVMAKHRITPRTLDLLVALRRAGEPYVRTPSELAHLLVLTPGGVSQRLDRLEQDGWVERSMSTSDRRGVSVRLSADGLARLDALIGDYMAHEEALLHGLSARDRERLAGLLLALDDSIRSAPAPG